MRRRILSCVCVALSLVAVGSVEAAGKPYHAELEAEAFDNVPCFGNWHAEKGTGWYGKEHVHASGQAVAICDQFNVGAAMLKKLGEPIPPGKVNVFAYVYRMRGGERNAIEVALGTLKDGQFQSHSSCVFSWDDSVRGGYIWLKHELELNAACDTVRVEATEVTRTGIGDNPEQEYAYIFFDKLYLTNSPDVKIQPSRWKAKLIKPEKARSTYVSREHSQAQEFLKKQKAEVSLPEPGAGNRLRNSGFELGVEPWWFAPDSFQEGYNLTVDNLDRKAPFQGKCSLRVPLAPYRAAFAGSVACWPFLVNGDRDYTLSFQARADVDGVSFAATFYNTKSGKYSTRAFNDAWRGGWKGLGTGKGTLTTSWARHTTTIRSKPGQELLYFEITFNANTGGAVWLDCLDFTEAGDGEYRPRAPIEVGISSRETARVHYVGQPLTFQLSASSEADAEKTVILDYEILDLAGVSRAKGTASIAVKGKGTFVEQLEIPFTRRGSFVLNYRAGGLAGNAGQLGFCVVPDPGNVPDRKENPFIGVISGLDDNSNKVHARLGHDIIVTLEGSTFMPIIGRQNLKEDGTIEWRDDEVSSCFRHDMDVLGYIVPWTWGRGKKLPWLKTYRCKLSGAEVMDLDGYADYVHKTVKHFPQVKRWILEDEADMRWTAKEFAPWMKRLYAEAKRANPSATVMCSLTPQMFEDVAKEIGHEHNDVVGGSFHGYREWFYAYQRHVMNAFKKTACWMIGVGWTSFPSTCIHDPWMGFQTRNSVSLGNIVSRVVKNLVIQQAIIAPEIQCRYTSRLNWVHGWSFAADNSFLPHSVAYVNALQFLRGCKPGGILYLDNASMLQACCFYKEGRPCVMLASLNQLGRQQIHVNLKASQVSVLDKALNPVPLAGQTVELALLAGELYLFRPVGDVKDEDFLRAFRQVAVRHTVWARTLCVPGKEGVDFGVCIRNDSAEPLAGVVTAGRSNLRHPDDTMRRVSIEPGTGTVVRFPFNDDLSAARSLGCIRDNFTFSDGKTFFWSNGFSWKYGRGLWMSKCLPATAGRPVKVDGDTKEWHSQSGSYLYMSWALDGSYGRRQGRYEAHKIKTQNDLSATVWSRHDGENLYFAARVYDNDLRFAPQVWDVGNTGDQLRLLLDTRLFADIESDCMDKDDYELILGPGLPEGKASITNAGKRAEVPARFTKTRHGWDAEASIPWKAIGGRTDVMGFDISLIDADGGLARRAELVWSGAGFARHDPRGFGQLIVVEGM